MAETNVNENGDGRQLARIDERTEKIQSDLTELKILLTSYEARLRCAEATLVRHGERQTIAHTLQSAWTIIVGTLAAYIGGTR